MTSWVINRKGMKTSQSQPDKRGKGANRIYRGESQQEAEGAGEAGGSQFTREHEGEQWQRKPEKEKP